MGERLILVKALRGTGVGQSVLDEIALLACGGKGKVDSLMCAAKLIDAFSELLVASDVSCDPPIVNIFCAICEDLVVGAVSLEDGEEPFEEGLCRGVFVIVNR